MITAAVPLRDYIDYDVRSGLVKCRIYHTLVCGSHINSWAQCRPYICLYTTSRLEVRGPSCRSHKVNSIFSSVDGPNVPTKGRYDGTLWGAKGHGTKLGWAAHTAVTNGSFLAF